MIIGFVGLIGSGKGTAADILVEKHGFIKESFANSVKDAVSTIFGWDRAMLEGDTIHSREWREEPDAWWSAKIKKPFSPRVALQLMGTEAGRNTFHTDLWIYSLERRMNPNKNYVIADVRFPNEIEMIQKLGGKVYRIKRGPDPKWYGNALKENQTDENELWLLEDLGELMEQKYPEVHSSEWAWVGANYNGCISNDSDISQLEKAISSLLKDYNLHIEDFDSREIA